MQHAADGAFGAKWGDWSAMPFGDRVRPDRFFDSDAAPSERTYAMFNHLTSVLIFIVGIPVVGALIMWLIKKDESPFLNDHGKEAVHFQISLAIYSLVAAGFAVATFGLGAPLSAIAVVGIFVLGIVGTVLGARAAHRGEYFRYPMTLRFF